MSHLQFKNNIKLLNVKLAQLILINKCNNLLNIYIS